MGPIHVKHLPKGIAWDANDLSIVNIALQKIINCHNRQRWAEENNLLHLSVAGGRNASKVGLSLEALEALPPQIQAILDFGWLEYTITLREFIRLVPFRPNTEIRDLTGFDRTMIFDQDRVSIVESKAPTIRITKADYEANRLVLKEIDDFMK